MELRQDLLICGVPRGAFVNPADLVTVKAPNKERRGSMLIEFCGTEIRAEVSNMSKWQP